MTGETTLTVIGNLTNASATGQTVTGYLAVDQLDIWDEFFGIPVAWIGEDNDAIALTTDRRRGLAALHALGRRDLGGPVTCDTSGQDPLVFGRFTHDPELDEDNRLGWYVTRCEPTDSGAIALLWLPGLSERSPRLRTPTAVVPFD